MKEDFTFNNKNDFFQRTKPLIKVAINIEIATPFISKKGTNTKFNVIPINNEVPAHKSETFSLPLIIRISAADPKIELIKCDSKIKKSVIFGI